MSKTLVQPDRSATRGDLFTPLARCWVCDGEVLEPRYAEEIRIGQAVNDPEVADVLVPYEAQPFQLNRCRDCGFCQPDRLPSHPRYFEALYNQKWGAEWLQEQFENSGKDYLFATILAELGRRVRSGERSLLDVGTHVGRMLHLAREAGWRPEGIELNPRTAAYAAQRTGLPVHRLDAARLADRGERYAAVVLTDVLEHIPDPVRLLETLRRLVQPGGWIAVKVPHGPNQWRKQALRALFDRTTDTRIATSLVHVNHFTPGSLKRALARAGFDEIGVTTGAPEFWVGRGLKFALADLGRRLVYQTARWIPGGTNTPLAMNLQAYGRKPDGPA